VNKSDLDPYLTLSAKQDMNLQKLDIDTDIAANHQDRGKITKRDSKSLTLLYVLAHEMGHIKWRKDVPADGSCGLSDFASESWLDPANAPTYAKDHRWTDFGDDFGDRNAIINPKPKKAGATELFTIYQNSVTTALAAANPEEDFVEAYAMQAITLAAPN